VVRLILFFLLEFVLVCDWFSVHTWTTFFNFIFSWCFDLLIYYFRFVVALYLLTERIRLYFHWSQGLLFSERRKIDLIFHWLLIRIIR